MGYQSFTTFSRRADAIAAWNKRAAPKEEPLAEYFFPLEWRLTASEATVLRVIASRPFASSGFIYDKLYNVKAGDGAGNARLMPERHIISVFVSQLRRKLSQAAGIGLYVVSGQGYYLRPDHREVVNGYKFNGEAR